MAFAGSFGADHQALIHDALFRAAWVSMNVALPSPPHCVGVLSVGAGKQCWELSAFVHLSAIQAGCNAGGDRPDHLRFPDRGKRRAEGIASKRMKQRAEGKQGTVIFDKKARWIQDGNF